MAVAIRNQREVMSSTSATSAVLQRHMDTMGKHDLEGILADYADDAVMFSPAGMVKGKAALRPTMSLYRKKGVRIQVRSGLRLYGLLMWPPALRAGAKNA